MILCARVVVGGLGILRHVEAREPPRALLVFRIRRDRQAHAVEELQPFAVVHPVGLDDELLVVHALPGDRHVGRLGLGVLLDQSLVTLGVHLQDVVAGAQRVQLRPAVEVLEGVVGAVVRAPAHEALQVAAVVEVLLEELPAGGDVVGQELPLEPGPARRRHGRVDPDRHVRRRERVSPGGCRQRADRQHKNDSGFLAHDITLTTRFKASARITVLYTNESTA